MNVLKYALKKNPIIISITDPQTLDKALLSQSNIIILMRADLRTLEEVTNKIKKTDNLIFVHIDLVKGLKRDASGIEFMAENIGIDGIVTTNSNPIKIAKRMQLLTIQRLFILDSASIKQGIKSIGESNPDAVEILPGIVVPHIKQHLILHEKPIIIAAGLINNKEEVLHILNNGAEGVSSSSTNLWTLSSEIKRSLADSAD